MQVDNKILAKIIEDGLIAKKSLKSIEESVASVKEMASLKETTEKQLDTYIKSRKSLPDGYSVGQLFYTNPDASGKRRLFTDLTEIERMISNSVHMAGAKATPQEILNLANTILQKNLNG